MDRYLRLRVLRVIQPFVQNGQGFEDARRQAISLMEITIGEMQKMTLASFLKFRRYSIYCVYPDQRHSFCSPDPVEIAFKIDGNYDPPRSRSEVQKRFEEARAATCAALNQMLGAVRSAVEIECTEGRYM